MSSNNAWLKNGDFEASVYGMFSSTADAKWGSALEKYVAWLANSMKDLASI